MPNEVIVRVGSGASTVDFAGSVVSVGPEAKQQWETSRAQPGTVLLLTGDRDYTVALGVQDPGRRALLEARRGKLVRVVFPGRTAVRRKLEDLGGKPAKEGAPPALDLTAGLAGAAPLWLLADGGLGTEAVATSPRGMAAEAALVNAARWISSRRQSTFEQLFPPSAFHPDQPVRTERLSVSQAAGTLEQVKSALAAAAVGGDAAKGDPLRAAEVRSASISVLSHLVATALKDPSFRGIADEAAAAMFAVIDAEQGDETARPALRAHVIYLLQMRAPALGADDRDRARSLLQGLVRKSPPYDELTGAWSFVMCSAYDFHEGECGVILKKFQWKEIEMPADAPQTSVRFGAKYRVFEAPFKTPSGKPVRIFARSASPTNENAEMGSAYFTGLLINRHAQLGSYDMRAAAADVKQAGYKLMMNSQCAGLTTRFAISRMFPDADIYSSWDSTYFRQGADQEIIASEGLDCFMAVLEGMRRGEDFSAIDRRIREVQWSHEQARFPGFTQFIGPAHPLFAARFNDVNQDGRADYYDGFLDFRLTAIAEDLQHSITPRDPGVPASQISGEAAIGLNWAAGSLDRVAQYSDIWAGLSGDSELLYAFEAAGFYSQREPPADVPRSPVAQEPGRLPAVCRYRPSGDGGLSCDVMMHSHFSHSAKELKRLLIAADAMQRAFDLGYLKGDAVVSTPSGQRCAILLTLAGLLEFPADQNLIDGLWAMALKMLNLPELSRSVVRACITEQDHDLSNYYGSRRGLRQLVEALPKSDPLAWEKLRQADPLIGRAGEIDFGGLTIS